MSSKEKICLHEREKHPPPALRSTPAEEEEEEPPPPPPPAAPGPGQAKASSSSSSEEESESESDAESGERRPSGERCTVSSAGWIYFFPFFIGVLLNRKSSY